MLIDPHVATLPEFLDADVCIIGAGIAGILLAHKLANAGKSIILLEAGALVPAHPAESAAHDSVTGAHPGRQPHAKRVEMPAHLHPGTAAPPSEGFGGTSLTWGGQLLPPPDPPPYAVRTATDHGFLSAPAGRQLAQASSQAAAESSTGTFFTQLAPFLAEAERALGVDDLPYNAGEFFAATHGEVPALFAGIPEMTLRVSKFAPFHRRNLARTLGREVLDHPRVRVIPHARAAELVGAGLSSQTRRIEEVLVRLPGGKQLRVRAAEFALAAGTLESVRLLLMSRSIDPEGLGDRHGPLGRNVHDHLTVDAAVFTGNSRERVLRELRPWLVRTRNGTTMHSLKLETNPELRRRLRLVHCMAHLTIDEPDGSAAGVVRAILRKRQQGGSTAASRGNAGRLAHALPQVLRLAWAAYVQKRRYVSAQATIALRLNAQQASPTQSQILLSEELDERGQPKPVLQWVIEPTECSALVDFAGWIRQHLGELAGDPSVRWNAQLFPLHGVPATQLIENLTDARHLMGGALTGTDPRTSVVDPDLRVHGVANLHVISLAVFGDGSAQLPTLSLMALALRLAERLSR